MTCNLAVVHPTKFSLPPSCSSRDSALDGIVFIAQLSNIAARLFETVNDFEMSSNFL